MRCRIFILSIALWGNGILLAQSKETEERTSTEREPELLLQNENPEKGDTTRVGFFRKVGNYFRESNEDKTFDKKFDFSILGGPHYSSDVKLGLGLVAAGLFRTDKNDPFTPPSNVSLYGDIATSGFYVIGVRGNTFFDRARYRLDYKLYFYSMPGDFWGLGYDMARHDVHRSEYHRYQSGLKVDFMYRLTDNLYAGANLNFNYIRGKDFERPEYLNGQKNSYTNFGPGVFLMYDSRDYVTAPHQGWLFKLESGVFPEFLGNKQRFTRTELTLDYYHRLWRGGVMAYDLHGQYHSGETPWTMLAQMGGSHRMRGYYEGRYRDKGLIEAQVELRQQVWKRIGFTLWGGMGNVFPTFSDYKWSHTLPNYGVGFRWEFKKRVNVRLDYGLGKGESGFIFNINEAF